MAAYKGPLLRKRADEVAGDDDSSSRRSAERAAQASSDDSGYTFNAAAFNSMAASRPHGNSEERNDCAGSVEEPLHRATANKFIAVGTYNIRHPEYGVKYSMPESINDKGESNWKHRAPAIGGLLRSSYLDVYLLQEVSERTLADLAQYTQDYTVKFFEHPARSAHDGVAVLLRRDRFQVIESYSCPFQGRGKHAGNYFMNAGVVSALDSSTGAYLLFASTHFYKKRTLDPQKTLQEFLQDKQQQRAFHAVVWGGTCNRSYATDPIGYVSNAGSRPNHDGVKQKLTNWIFCSQGCTVSRAKDARAEAFISSTWSPIEATGHPPSDHRGEAIAFAPPSAVADDEAIQHHSPAELPSARSNAKTTLSNICSSMLRRPLVKHDIKYEVEQITSSAFQATVTLVAVSSLACAYVGEAASSHKEAEYQAAQAAINALSEKSRFQALRGPLPHKVDEEHDRRRSHHQRQREKNWKKNIQIPTPTLFD